MSVTVSTCQQISNSPLNHSTAKQIWSFPKSDRFHLNESSICSQAFYDLPDTKNKRKAGIGYGTKYDFGKNRSLAPAPSAYILKSDIEIQLNKKRGFPFGLSREAMAITGITGNLNQWSPAPGKYNIGSTLSNQRYTMRPKLENQFNLGKSNVPGPGTYAALPAINEKGKYLISKFHNSCATLINPARSQRFEHMCKGIQILNFSKHNHLLLAQEPTNMIKLEFRKMGATLSVNLKIVSAEVSHMKCGKQDQLMLLVIKKYIDVLCIAKVPGPGSYKLPSEFGYYESRKKTQ